MAAFLGGLSLQANGSIKPMSVVSLDTTGDHLCRQATGASDSAIIGIAQIAVDAPPGASDIFAPGSGYTPVAAASGEQLTVYGPGDVCPVILGNGSVVPGTYLTSDSTGNAIIAASGNNLVGKAIQAGVAGDQIDIVVFLGKI